MANRDWSLQYIMQWFEFFKILQDSASRLCQQMLIASYRPKKKHLTSLLNMVFTSALQWMYAVYEKLTYQHNNWFDLKMTALDLLCKILLNALDCRTITIIHICTTRAVSLWKWQKI